MSREFRNIFSPENQRTFQALSIPKLQTLAPNDDCAPATLLLSAGVKSFECLFERRERAYPIELGSVDDDGAYSPFRARLHGIVKDFFLGNSVCLERSQGREVLSRRPPQDLDVRPVGSCKLPSTGDTVKLFCCRYGETHHSEGNRYENAWSYRDATMHPRDIQLAIPSRAGLTAPDALSLVAPLHMYPREFIEDGEAGAVFACAERMPGFIADLYWSEAAFMESLNRVQEIGRKLISKGAIMRATMRGTGENSFEEPSAILSKLYESAAQFGQTQEVPSSPLEFGALRFTRRGMVLLRARWAWSVSRLIIRQKSAKRRYFAIRILASRLSILTFQGMISVFSRSSQKITLACPLEIFRGTTGCRVFLRRYA